MNRFIIVTGLPASGKSTVGAALAAALELFWLDKDEILESLFDELGVSDADWRRRLSRSADAVMQRLAMRAPGAVISSWWRHPSSQLASGTPTHWLTSLPGELTEVHCHCSPSLAVDRFFARQRRPGHLDHLKSRIDELERFEQFARHGPLGLGRVAQVNTEQTFDVRGILSRINS